MSTGSSGSTSTVTQKADPWSKAQPYLEDLMGRAKWAYENLPSQYFPGSTYIGPSLPTEFGLGELANASQRQEALLNTAGWSINNILGGTDPYMQQLARTNAGDYLHGSPELDEMFGRMAGRITDQVGAQFSGAGRYGSGKYADALGRSLGDLGAQIYGQNYSQERQNQLNAAQSGLERQIQASAFLPGLAQAQSMPAQTLLQIGGIDEGYQGLALKDAMDRFYGQQQLPWDDLLRYNTLIQGFGGLGGQSSSTSTQPGVSPLAGGLGGLSAILGLLSGFGGGGGTGLLSGIGAGTPVGWALGGLGLLGGLFGD